MKPLLVYLSGGMSGNYWQGLVSAQCAGLDFIDPTEHGLENALEYAAWDLCGVRRCDILFAYMASDNPSGIGLALELGYAKALGKTVILVDESTKENMKIVQEVADVTFRHLTDGIEYLRAYERM